MSNKFTSSFLRSLNLEKTTNRSTYWFRRLDIYYVNRDGMRDNLINYTPKQNALWMPDDKIYYPKSENVFKKIIKLYGG